MLTSTAINLLQLALLGSARGAKADHGFELLPIFCYFSG
jgi:hypothetical protein